MSFHQFIQRAYRVNYNTRFLLKSVPPTPVTYPGRLTTSNSILVSAGKDAGIWVVRGIAIGGAELPFSPIQEHRF